MRTLSRRTIGLLESRRSGELMEMVHRLGGAAVSAPAVREVASVDHDGAIVHRIVNGEFQIAVVLTGAGASALFAEAERVGRLEDMTAALRALTIACRGPKPLAVLKRHHLIPSVVSDRPHTTAELLEAMRPLPLANAPVLLLHYGERNQPFADALRDCGAVVNDVCLYEWALPEDVAPLQEMIRRVVAGRIDAVLFTSQIQFRFAIQIAAAMDADADFVRALNENVIVGAIGPVCASALRAGGVVPDVIPAAGNSASLVGAVADYFTLTTPEEHP